MSAGPTPLRFSTLSMLNAATVNFYVWRIGGWDALTLAEREALNIVRRRLECQAAEELLAGHVGFSRVRQEAAELIRENLAGITIIAEAS